MSRIRRVCAVAVAACALLVAPATAATSSGELGPSTIAASLDARPGTPTGLAMEITYRGTEGADDEPPAITHLDIGLPPGIEFNGSAVPVCTASDAELMALGRLSCPPDTQIGHGTISVVLGPSMDPSTTDTVWYNGGDHLIEIVLAPSGPGALARERLYVREGHLVADVALFPGGPPNSVTVTGVTFEIYERGPYLTTPRRCRARQGWTFSAVFGFDDGTTQTARATAPCTNRR